MVIYLHWKLKQYLINLLLISQIPNINSILRTKKKKHKNLKLNFKIKKKDIINI